MATKGLDSPGLIEWENFDKYFMILSLGGSGGGGVGGGVVWLWWMYWWWLCRWWGWFGSGVGAVIGVVGYCRVFFS